MAALTDRAGNGGLLGLLKKNRLRLNRDLADYEARQDFSPACYAETRAVTAAIAQHLGGRCIDVGCGDMPFRSLIERHVDRYDTFDVEARVPGVTYVGDIQDMQEVTGARYDSALCLEVLEHVPEPWRAARELYRILKPGGRLVCSVPHLSRLHEEPHDYYRYTHYGLRHMFSSAGFDVVSIAPTGGLFCFLGHQVATLVLLPVWHVPVLKDVAFFLNKWAVVRLAWFLDRHLDRNKAFALGYLCVLEKPAASDADASASTRGSP